MGITKSNLFSKDINEMALTAKVLAHPARIAIIKHLLKLNSCINSTLVSELGLAQATISQHLKELKQSGIIQGTIEGNSMCYCINPQRWNEVREQFNALFDQLTPNNCC